MLEVDSLEALCVLYLDVQRVYPAYPTRQIPWAFLRDTQFMMTWFAAQPDDKRWYSADRLLGIVSSFSTGMMCTNNPYFDPWAAIKCGNRRVTDLEFVCLSECKAFKTHALKKYLPHLEVVGHSYARDYVNRLPLKGRVEYCDRMKAFVTKCASNPTPENCLFARPNLYQKDGPLICEIYLSWDERFRALDCFVFNLRSLAIVLYGLERVGKMHSFGQVALHYLKKYDAAEFRRYYKFEMSLQKWNMLPKEVRNLVHRVGN